MHDPCEDVSHAWLRRAGQFGRTALLGTARTIVGALIFVAIAINFANVVARYLFASPLVWAEEIMVFLVIWCVFIGAVLVSWERDHLKMDLLAARLPGSWRKAVTALELFITGAVCVFMVVQAYEVASLMLRNDQKSVVAQVPMVIPHGAVLLGFVLILLVIAARWRRYLSSTDEYHPVVSALEEGVREHRDSDSGNVHER